MAGSCRKTPKNGRRVKAVFRCPDPLAGFSQFQSEPTVIGKSGRRTRSPYSCFHLPTIFRSLPAGNNVIPAGSHRKSMEPDAGMIDLGTSLFLHFRTSPSPHHPIGELHSRFLSFFYNGRKIIARYQLLVFSLS